MGNKADIEYSRELDLEEKFNLFWNQALKTNGEDYLKRLTSNDLIEMKKAVSNINNLITLRVTMAFIDEICRLGIINSKQADNMKKDVKGAHPNTNGFDVHYPNPKREDENDGLKLIAEVKCNIPVGGDKFGAAQRNEILKDLKGLRKGKGKYDENYTKPCKKFMVLLELQDGEEVKEAMNNLREHNNEYKDKCVDLDGINIENIDENHIYIVYVNINTA